MQFVWDRARRRLGFAIVSGVVLAFGFGSDGRAQNPTGSHESLFRADDPLWRQAFRESEAKQRAFERRRARRSERESRRESRLAFRRLRGADVVDLARRTFSEQLADRRALKGIRLEDGARVLRYLDDHQALVKDENDRSSVVQSLLPMRADQSGDGTSEKHSIDLALESRGDGFVSRNPLAPALYPTTATEPVALDKTGVSVVPLGASQVRAQERDGRLFFPGAIDDATDYVVAPTISGFEAFWQLRSGESAETLRLRVGLPAGSRLRPGATGSPSEGAFDVVDVATDVVLTSISAPQAFDGMRGARGPQGATAAMPRCASRVGPASAGPSHSAGS